MDVSRELEPELRPGACNKLHSFHNLWVFFLAKQQTCAPCWWQPSKIKQDNISKERASSVGLRFVSDAKGRKRSEEQAGRVALQRLQYQISNCPICLEPGHRKVHFLRNKTCATIINQIYFALKYVTKKKKKSDISQLRCIKRKSVRTSKGEPTPEKIISTHPASVHW